MLATQGLSHDEILQRSKKDINHALDQLRDRLLSIIETAWSEGKRNAETEAVTEVTRDALGRLIDDDGIPPVLSVTQDGNRWLCRKCNCLVGTLIPTEKTVCLYCPECGRKVKWEQLG